MLKTVECRSKSFTESNYFSSANGISCNENNNKRLYSKRVNNNKQGKLTTYI